MEEAKNVLSMLPAVDAAPLDKLCEWLGKVAGKPCHESCAGCEDDEDGTGYKECWKKLILQEVCDDI